jgi:hypothetical protein
MFATRSRRVGLVVAVLAAIAAGVFAAAHDEVDRRTPQTSVSTQGSVASAANAAYGGPSARANRAIRQRADGLGVAYTSSSCERVRPHRRRVTLFVCHVADQSANQDDFTATGFGHVRGTTCVVAVHRDGDTDVSDCT